MKQEIKEGAAPVEATSAGAARLTWTTERPKVDGKYYHRLPGKGSGVSDVVIVGGEPVSPGDDGEMYGFAAECEWAGPIPEPAEAAPAGAELIRELAAALEKIANHFDMDGEGDKDIVKMYSDWKGLALEMAETARAALTKAQGSR